MRTIFGVLPTPATAKAALAGDPGLGFLLPPQEAKGRLLRGPGRKLEKALAHNGPLGMTLDGNVPKMQA